MEKIDEQLNNLSSVEIPSGIHQLVMHKVNYQKVKPTLFVSFALLVLSFIFLALYINAKLIDAEFIDMMQDFFNIFSFNFSFINTIFGSFFEIISPMLFLSALISLLVATYVGKKITMYQFYRV